MTSSAHSAFSAPLRWVEVLEIGMDASGAKDAMGIEGALQFLVDGKQSRRHGDHVRRSVQSV